MDHIQATFLMTKHIRAQDPPLDYTQTKYVDLCEPGAVKYSSISWIHNLPSIRKTFYISTRFVIVYLGANGRTHLPTKKCIKFYRERLKAGLRFPLHCRYKDIMACWDITLGNFAPNCVRQIVSFILICKSFGIPINLEVFKKII